MTWLKEVLPLSRNEQEMSVFERNTASFSSCLCRVVSDGARGIWSRHGNSLENIMNFHSQFTKEPKLLKKEIEYEDSDQTSFT